MLRSCLDSYQTALFLRSMSSTLGDTKVAEEAMKIKQDVQVYAVRTLQLSFQLGRDANRAIIVRCLCRRLFFLCLLCFQLDNRNRKAMEDSGIGVLVPKLEIKEEG